MRQERINLLKAHLQSRILVLDGAMGTSLQAAQLSASDFGGVEYEGCNEHLVLSAPQVIEKIHRDYLEAGCDIIETNTFGATPLVLDEFGLSGRAREINFVAAQLARKAADRYSSHNKPRFVAGSMGPTTKSLSVTGGVGFTELVETYGVQIEGLWEGGVDYFLLETCQDSRNIKAALMAMDRYFEKIGETIPIAISGTIEPMGAMLAGQSVESFVISFSHRDLLYIGLNCATGPEFMTEPIRAMAALSPFPVACVPNAGLPDEEGRYAETPQMLARVLRHFVESGWVNLLGGCCGTQPHHIQALSQLAEHRSPRKVNPHQRCFLSGIDFVEVSDENRPVLVGERTNVIGSRKFKRLICEENFDEATDIGKAQTKKGAQVIDVCLANPDRNELVDMEKFLAQLVRKIKAPLMIDSTDPQVIKSALTYCQGRALINSINLEDGEERFHQILPMAKQFGAAVVIGTIDDHPEQGMGITRERKLAIAERAYSLATERFGMQPQDIFWDPLVFPCATGDKQYIGSARETIEGLRLIKQRFPLTKSVLGISNVSFGLPPAGREVLNSVFLYHCVQAGLDLALVNTELWRRYNTINEEELLLATNVLFQVGDDPIGAFANHFREQKTTRVALSQDLPLEERLAQYIVEGSRDGLVADLNLALKEKAPLAIINGPLMNGMNQVGKLFNENKLIVAEVLQSAESMKAAVDHLSQFMAKNETATLGKVLLATVKGDVHDIGKNLVDIILSNNGFEVVDLGIKIPSDVLLAGIREHRPDVVGLSGLLVKSAHQMVSTAEDLSRVGECPPLIVGGAALSLKFVEQRISPAYSGATRYAKDAMQALDVIKAVLTKTAIGSEQVGGGVPKEKAPPVAPLSQIVNPSVVVTSLEKSTEHRGRSPHVSMIEQPPPPPDFDLHCLQNVPIGLIWSYINPQMLYGRHLGIKGHWVKKLVEMKSDPNIRKQIKKEAPKVLEIWDLVEEVKQEYQETPIMKPSAIYQFFPALSVGERIELYSGSGRANRVASFEFQRQASDEFLCLADYVNPPEAPLDNLALFVVSVGQGVRQQAQQLRQSGDYLKSVIVQVLAIESAEAFAEFLHAQLRTMWGFMDPPQLSKIDLFRAQYQGKRFSFGYPACPQLEYQRQLFDLLKPERIGVELTEGFMMDPEASVSAIVFHHPQAKYFSVGH